MPVDNSSDEKHGFIDNHSELEPFDQSYAVQDSVENFSLNLERTDESLQISGVNNTPRIPTMDLFQIPELMPKAAPEIIYQSGKKIKFGHAEKKH